MTASRAKGTAAETAVVRFLQDFQAVRDARIQSGWPHAERRALHGNADIGDIAGLPGVVLEVKSAKRTELAAWLDELDAEIVNAHADTGVLVVKRRGHTNPGKWFAIMSFDRWCVLLNEAGR